MAGAGWLAESVVESLVAVAWACDHVDAGAVSDFMRSCPQPVDVGSRRPPAAGAAADRGDDRRPRFWWRCGAGL